MRSADKKMNKEESIPKRWEVVGSWIIWYFRGFIAKNFHALRISKTGLPKDPGEGPLIFMLNHPSWWDPITGILLAQIFSPRATFSPIDSQGLQKYRFLRWIGFYPVELGSPKGAIAFLKTTTQILNSPKTMVWITVQGEFSDPRIRPLILKSGIAHLARKLDSGNVIPIAIEYPFWNERYPEALARFGQPIPLGKGKELKVSEWTEIFANALEANMNILAQEAISRNPDLFKTHIQGRAGIGGVYDVWRRIKSWISGKSFDPEHGYSNKGAKE